MKGRYITSNRIKFTDESRKIFFEELNKKSTFNQLSKKLSINLNNFYFYKSGRYTTPELVFNLGLKIIDKSGLDFEFQVLPPNWGSIKGARIANKTPKKREQNRVRLSRMNKKKWKLKEFREKMEKSREKIFKSIKEQGEMTIEKVRIISHLLFDGCLCDEKGYNYFRFACSSPLVTQQFINDVFTIYGLETNGIFNENKKGCVSVNYNSILAVRDLKKFCPSYSCKSNDIEVPKFIKNGSTDFKREFLRCFWSDDGGITVSPKYKRFWLIGCQKNLKFLYEIGEIHELFNINYLIYEQNSHLLIVRNQDKKRFLRKVGFLKGSLVTKGKYIGMKKNFLLKKLNLGIFP